MRKHLLKKVLSVALSLTLIGSAAAILPAALPESGIKASAATYGVFEYEEEDNEVTITRYNGSGGKVTIPSEINGKKVTSIGNYAFFECTSLTSITIPSGVTSIGDCAFWNCTSLTSITIPSSVTSIGERAFEDCTSLTSITIPSSVTSIGDSAFWNCTSLTSITIPSGVTSIGAYAFYKCTSLTSITIPSSVTSIGDWAFSGCTSLTSITIPSGVTSIGDSAFYYCTSLTSITIPSSVTSIGNWAFIYCTSLTSINVDSGNKNYSSKDGVLYNKSKTELVCCPGGKKSVSIPSGVTSIGYQAFSYCTSLTSITIPSSVTSIGDYAFSDCTSLTSITIPSSVTIIGYQAFSYCTSLTSITIPSSVTSIGEYAFEGCTSLKTIYGTKGSYAETYAKSNGYTFIGKDDPTVAVTGIKLDKTKCTIEKGKTLTLTATITPTNATNKNITWTSSNTNVATVANGKITAKSAGTATITAKTSNGKTAACKVTVKNPAVLAAGIKLDKTSTTLGKGETITLNATITPTNTTNKSVTWTTSNSSVATVSGGKITAKNNGTATITAKTSNGKTAACKVTVKSAPTKITLTKGVLTIGVGEKYSLGSNVNDGAGCATRTYRTSASSVVKMTKTNWTGEFVGVKPGVAYVTVRTYNGKEHSCKVTVKAAPKSVTISKKTLTMKVGQTATLSCWTNDGSGCAKRTFRTSNSSIVKMTNTNWTGSFKAVKAGTAWVTVRTYNGKESSCKVTVTK